MRNFTEVEIGYMTCMSSGDTPVPISLYICMNCIVEKYTERGVLTPEPR